MDPLSNLFNSTDPAAKDYVEEVRAAFGPTRKKVFILGAGVSVAAGSKFFPLCYSFY
jgi:hypothetical protein